MTNDKQQGALDLDFDLDELQALCDAVKLPWYGTCQIADGVTDDAAVAFIEAFSPDTVSELIALARRAAQPTEGSAAQAGQVAALADKIAANEKPLDAESRRLFNENRWDMYATDERAAAPTGWKECERIANLPTVHEALQGFSEDPTGDNGVYVVSVILGATGRAAEGATQAGDALTDAARDVLAERRRQVEQEGWTPELDDDYADGQLSMAAACYATQGDSPNFGPPDDWPWNLIWWKPTDDRRNLVKAGALILADIERLDRARIDGDKQGAQGGEHE